MGNGPLRGEGIGLPFDASVHGYRIDWLINVTTIFITILFAIMCVWMVWACWKHGRNHEVDYDHGTSLHASRTALLVSGIIFLIVDGNLFVNAMMDLDQAFWNFEEPTANSETVRIQVNAHQWAWDARYAGADGEFNTADDVVTLNDIRVPVGVPIDMQLASVDVIHSFYLPNFRIKQDAVPGMINRMWFQAKSTGMFNIGCAQHCGTAHYKMEGVLTVLEPAQYQQWLSEQSAEAVRKYEEALKNGPTERFLESQWGWNWEEAI